MTGNMSLNKKDFVRFSGRCRIWMSEVQQEIELGIARDYPINLGTIHD